ncbi:MAG TPA: hypothetical protein VLA05_09940 [Coriobacteriia bacterium]|nr:hypothetical protein [Coriobacteriia bacterium]
MRFEELLDAIREGRWFVPLSIGILVVGLAVVLVVAWPQIKPKPRPQAQSLSTVVTQPETQETDADLKPVPKETAAAIYESLGVEDTSKTTIHWEDAEQKVIIVRLQEGALNWKEYQFVEKDGTWVRK